MPSAGRPPSSSDEVVIPFIWVPDGEEPDPAELARMQDPIRIPAVFVLHSEPAVEPIEVAKAATHEDFNHRPFAPVGPDTSSRHRTRTQGGLSQAEIVLQRDVRDLAAVIWREAGGRPLAEQVAVGFALHNRMIRNHAVTVQEAWGGFAHQSPPPTDAARFERLAWDILEGRSLDPTGGATHFYSPHLMPRAGQPTTNTDVGGGLETAPGHLDEQTRQPVQTYRPSWAADPNFERVLLPGVDPWQFRFFRYQGNGRVR